MEALEIIDIIEQTTTDFNNSFNPEKYPDIRIGDFMAITTDGNRKTSMKAYGEQSGTQDLDNGLIDENTTVLDTEDVNITAKKAPYIDWGKSVVYTSLGVERASALGIKLDTVKLENLRGVALRSIQKVALTGHAKRKDVTGLLNNPSVEIEDQTKKKKLSEMTGSEARDWFLNLLKIGYERSGGILMPSTIAIDSMDLLTVSGKYDTSITDDKKMNVLRVVKEALREFAGQEITINGIPQNLASNAGKNNSARACVYTNSSDIIYQDWALAPTAGNVFQRSSLSFEVPMQAQYSGAIITQLDKFMYVDYNS